VAGVQFVVWSKAESAIKASKAATAFAAFDWLLFIVTVAVFGYFLHKHRVANGAVGFGGAQHNDDVEKTQAPVELHQVQEPQPVATQQQMYQQQLVYQQVPINQQQPTPYPAT